MPFFFFFFLHVSKKSKKSEEAESDTGRDELGVDIELKEETKSGSIEQTAIPEPEVVTMAEREEGEGMKLRRRSKLKVLTNVLDHYDAINFITW